MLNSPVSNEEWDEAPADERETREALLGNSGRGFVPIRKTFAQAPRSLTPSPACLPDR